VALSSAAHGNARIATVSKRKLPGPAELERLYAEFSSELPAIVDRLALRQDEVQFVEYVKVAMEWLRDRQQSA
jgi:hypothetical protein